MDIKSLVSNVIATCILILLFLLAFTWIFFDFYKTSSSLKDSLSIVSSLFGGIATLAAAYIASKLFNDWKVQHNKIIESSSAREIIELLAQTKTQMRFVKILLTITQPNNSNNTSLNSEILELVQKIHKIVEGCQDKLEIFNILKNEDDMKSEEFLKKLDEFSKSFVYFTQLAGVTQKMFIENKQDFIILAERYMDTCDEFNSFLMTYAKAE